MHLTINDREVVTDPGPRETLLDLLRERLGLTGTKRGCDRGECGACTVLLDGAPAYACLTLAAGCEGVELMTIEGVFGEQGTLAQRIRRSLLLRFLEYLDATQCGFCTPGQVLAAVALFERTDTPDHATIAEAMSGNLCRCGATPRILQALQTMSATFSWSPFPDEEMRSRGTAPGD